MSRADLRMSLVGDAYVQRPEPDSAFAPNMDFFKGADVLFCNLETVIADVGYGIEHPLHRAPRTDEGTLASYLGAGINVMNLANNPTTYHGLDAFLRCIDLLDEAGVVHGGGGRDLVEARRPAIIERNGTRIAFVCRASVAFPDAAATASRAGIAFFRIATVFEPRSRMFEVPGTPPITRTIPDPEDCAALAEDIAVAKEQADVVVLSWHWGLSPSSGARGELVGYQTEMAHFAIDHGVDLVIGHHPHVLQPIEVYKGKVIAYSLGNYVHDLTSASSRQSSMLLQCDIRDGVIADVSFVPGWCNGPGPALYHQPSEETEIVELMRTNSARFGTAYEVTPEAVRVVITPSPVLATSG